MGKNKTQKAAEARLAASEPAATTAATTPEPAAPAEPISESIQLAVDLCGPKPTAKAAKAVAKLQQKAAATPAAPRATCTQTKKDGTPCTAKALLGKETCVDHQPAWDRMTHEEHVAFGEWLRQARGPEIVEVIGWWKAKQIAKDQMGPVPTEQEGSIEK